LAISFFNDLKFVFFFDFHFYNFKFGVYWFKLVQFSFRLFVQTTFILSVKGRQIMIKFKLTMLRWMLGTCFILTPATHISCNYCDIISIPYIVLHYAKNMYVLGNKIYLENDSDPTVFLCVCEGELSYVYPSLLIYWLYKYHHFHLSYL